METKSSNKTLRKANKEKNDEFYTQLSDIEKELRHYKAQFK
ncbi:adenine-specific methyltransferase EcoRI family protein, partial [Ferruginibacter sp.]